MILHARYIFMYKMAHIVAPFGLELRNIVPHYCSVALAAKSTSSIDTPIPLLPL